MKEQRKIKLSAVVLVAGQLLDKIVRYSNGGLVMEELTLATIIQFVVDIGLTPVLLVIFIVFFLRKSKDDDARVQTAYTDSQKSIESINQSSRERENTLMSEFAKREELLRQESEKRENILRKEAEKRENILMCNQERMVESMNAISTSLSKIETTLSKMESRHESDINGLKQEMQSITHKIDKMDGRRS